MSQRLELVEAVVHRAPGQSIRDICRRVGISERIGHKWLTRFGAGQPHPRSPIVRMRRTSRRINCPRAILDALIALPGAAAGVGRAQTARRVAARAADRGLARGEHDHDGAQARRADCAAPPRAPGARGVGRHRAHAAARAE